MKVAIYGRSTSHNLSENIRLLFSKLQEHHAEVFVFNPFYEYLKKELDIKDDLNTFESHSDLREKADFVFSVGGDGTFLETVTLVRDSGIPILGINTGRLGFLANVAKTEISDAIDALAQNKFNIEKRALLSVTEPKNLFGEVNYALN